jgi:hypothetical protein
MGTARRLAILLGVNAIPISGVFLGHWDGATALTLYWWENLIGSLLVALRIVLHRRLTHKRGHQRLHLTLASRDNMGTDGPWKPGRVPRLERKGSFLGEFLTSALAATAVHGVLLWFVVARVLEQTADGAALRKGVLGVAALQVAGFAFDLRGLRERSFAWLRELAQDTVNRVTLIHLLLLVGLWVSLRNGGTLFGPFAVLKAMADVGNLLARAGLRVDRIEESPPWFTRAMNWAGPKGADFGDYWRTLKGEERRLEDQDEQVTKPPPPHARRKRRR